MTYQTGWHIVNELIKRGEGKLLFCRKNKRVAVLKEAASFRRVPQQEISSAELDRIAPGHRGFALEYSGGRERNGSGHSLPLDARIEELASRDEALVVLLDGITDPHNLGAILRSCDLFNVDIVITPHARSADRQNNVVGRASAGASAWVEVVEHNLNQSQRLLKRFGFWLYGADTEGTDIRNIDFPSHKAVLFGAEGRGIAPLNREGCDELVTIPTRGHITSLNVSNSVAIFLYEIRR